MRAFAQQMTERMKAVAAAGAVAAFWLAAWMLLAALVAQPLILPGPGAVALALLRLVCDASTWAILASSGARILGGLALAVGDRAPWAPALDGLALNVPAGGRACVMGASGAGKSTLLALAAGECTPCSMVFQDTRLVESASAVDNVLVCAGTHMDASSAAALLRLLVPGVDVHACVAELSGGQRRRVEIARALLCPGGAVILDEPFTGLDAAARDVAAKVVLDLLDDRTLLLATHDASDVQALNISDVITL